MTGQAVLVADKIGKVYKKTTALEDISFRITTGETVGIIGPNGAGKSTLMKIITGAVRPTSGSIAFNAGYTAPGRLLGFVLDPIGIPPEFTPLTYLQYEASVQRVAPSEIARIVDLFELGDFRNRRVGRLSTGQRQRIGIAAASLSTPEILMLDEPTNGLDIESVNWLRGMVNQRKQQGLTTIISSHNFDELGRIVERVLIIQRTIRFDGLYADAVAGGTSLEDQYFQLTDRPTGGFSSPPPVSQHSGRPAPHPAAQPAPHPATQPAPQSGAQPMQPTAPSMPQPVHQPQGVPQQVAPGQQPVHQPVGSQQAYARQYQPDQQPVSPGAYAPGAAPGPQSPESGRFHAQR